MNIDMTVEERYRLLRNQLSPLYGAGEATSMARLIFHSLKGWDTTGLVVHAPDKLSPFILSRIDEIVNQLKTGRPLQYILGEGRFYGMTLRVAPGVLIPRQETEELVEIIVKQEEGKSDLRVLDIGSGSGAIAIALSRNLRFPQVSALDISEAALEIARDNAERLHAGIKFIHADIFDWAPPGESLDIIVSNPPYIAEKERAEMERNVLDYEPAEALFVPDSDPLRFYGRIAGVAMRGLCQGGRLYFEINPVYADELGKLLSDAGYADIKFYKDISGRLRFASAIKSQGNHGR